MARMRGVALRLGELLAGTRFQRAFIKPGGVVYDPGDKNIKELLDTSRKLRQDLAPIIDLLLRNQVANDRMHVGRVSTQLAKDFGMVGVPGRASGIAYDARRHFKHGVYPAIKPPLPTQTNGDVFSRAKVRIFELTTSLQLIEEIIGAIKAGPVSIDLPDELPKESVGLGVVEGHRGELIHLIFTDKNGKIARYAIKDPSLNNWTGLAIAIRNNLVADFPLCNKSFGLSYSGHDL